MLEHLQDPGRDPYTSIWASWAVRALELMTSAQRFLLRSVHVGTASVKPTCMMSSDGSLSALCLRCCHGPGAHVPLQGRRAGGGWNTTAAAAYLEQLKRFLAERVVESVVAARSRGGRAFDRHGFNREAFRHRVLTECSSYLHGRQLSGGGRRFQA